jgi:hypothetical protein
MGNIDEKGAREVTDVVAQHFLDPSRALHDAEAPKFKSLRLPNQAEAVSIFGPAIVRESIPVKYQELACSPSEENNAVEVTLQAGSESSLGYEGISILDLIICSLDLAAGMVGFLLLSCFWCSRLVLRYCVASCCCGRLFQICENY